MLGLGAERDEALYDEAQKILNGANEHGVTLRLLGAIAVRLHSETARKRNAERHLTDLDFMARASERAKIEKFFSDLGYDTPGMFNKLHGAERLKFWNDQTKLNVDIFFAFRMCHTFDFSKRLRLDSRTLTVSDLLMTKLQIVQQNEKDVIDIISLVGDHDLGQEDELERINAKYISNLCSQDWPIWRTFTMSIDKVIPLVGTYEPEPERKRIVVDRLKRLREQMDSVPKSMGWKVRAKVGDRKKWYEEPTVL